MNKFVVAWEKEIEADSPEDAGDKAVQALRDELEDDTIHLLVYNPREVLH